MENLPLLFLLKRMPSVLRMKNRRNFAAGDQSKVKSHKVERGITIKNF